MKTVIKSDQVFMNHTIQKGYLVIEEGHFQSFYNEEPKSYDRFIDYTDSLIAPGLVDTHIHGYNGNDVMDGDFESLNQISMDLLSCGVTSFLPTTLTSSIDQTSKVVELIGQVKERVEGAKIKGIFLEGPFFTEKHKGAQNPAYFMDPSIEILKHWQELSRGNLKKIALAPEREGAMEFIKYAVSQDIHVALAHSNATYEIAKQAVEMGASIFVHTFNGMSGLHHREPGMVGAAMNLQEVYAELICDGHHVNPVSAKILMDHRNRDQIVLITDCMTAGGKEEGNYILGELDVVVKDGAARIENGSLAGSVLELKEAIKNVVDWNIATKEEAIKMASTVPAHSMGLSDCGTIEIGKPADFIVLDKEWHLEATYLDGECRFKAE